MAPLLNFFKRNQELRNAKDEKRKRPPCKRLGQLLTLERNIAFNDIGTIQSRDTTPTPLPQRCGSQLSSAQVSSRPASRAFSSRPASRAVASGSPVAPGSPVPPTPRSKSSLSGGSFGARAKRVFCEDSCDYKPGGWALRYATFNGTMPMPQNSSPAQASKDRRKSAEKTKPGAHGGNNTAPTEESEAIDESLGNQEMANKAHRTTRIRKGFSGLGLPKWEYSRRMGISGVGQSKLQVKSAIRLFSRLHPEKLLQLKQVTEDPSEVGVEEQRSEQEMIEDLLKTTGLPEDEIFNMHKMFKKYDVDNSHCLDKDEVRKAIADFGVTPSNSDEQAEVNELLCEYDKDGSGEFSLTEFVRALRAVKGKMKDMQLETLQAMFLEADADGSGELGMEEIEGILELMHLKPRNEEESRILRKITKEVDADGSGEISFEEFLILMDKARERITISRREQEQRIATEFHLTDAMFEEFRPELLHLKEVFDRYDRDNSGSLDHEEAILVLTDSGIKPQTRDERLQMEELLEDLDPDYDHLNFKDFLFFMQAVRKMIRDVKSDEMWDMFLHYDDDRSGELGSAEINKILEDMGLLPRTKQEQDEMKAILMEVDVDGSGKMDFDEFQVFMQKVRQRLDQIHRATERQIGMELGFDDDHVQEFRKAFDTLDNNAYEQLTITDIRQVMRLLNQHISADDLRTCFDELDEDGSGYMEFNEFLRFMKLVEEKKEHQRRLAREKEDEKHKSKNSGESEPPAHAQNTTARRGAVNHGVV